MAPGPEVFEGRRDATPQAPLAREVPRAEMVAALQDRFRLPVAVIVGGAGSGKTTALTQSVRANLVSPMGIDAWVSCEPADEDDRRLSAAMVAALGLDRTAGEPPCGAAVPRVTSWTSTRTGCCSRLMS